MDKTIYAVNNKDGIFQGFISAKDKLQARSKLNRINKEFTIQGCVSLNVGILGNKQRYEYVKTKRAEQYVFA